MIYNNLVQGTVNYFCYHYNFFIIVITVYKNVTLLRRISNHLLAKIILRPT